jgi:hypothetical protein
MKAALRVRNSSAHRTTFGVGEAKEEVVTIIDGTTVTADAEALVPGWDELITPRDLIDSSSKWLRASLVRGSSPDVHRTGVHR